MRMQRPVAYNKSSQKWIWKLLTKTLVANAGWQWKRKLLGQLLVVRRPLRNLGPAGINRGRKLPQLIPPPQVQKRKMWLSPRCTTETCYRLCCAGCSSYGWWMYRRLKMCDFLWVVCLLLSYWINCSKFITGLRWQLDYICELYPLALSQFSIMPLLHIILG